MTATRIVVPGATTAITRRTAMRKAFLGPWHPLVLQCWLYALARAQDGLDVAIHHGVLVVSHEHLNATGTERNLPELLRRVHHDLACCVNVLLAHGGFDRPGNVFGGRNNPSRVRDRTTRPEYVIEQPVPGT